MRRAALGLLLLLAGACGPVTDHGAHLAVSPEIVHLHAAAEGTLQSVPLSLVNVGEGRLEVRRLRLAVTTGYSVQAPGVPFSLGPGEELMVQLQYRPGPGAPLSNVLDVESEHGELARVELFALPASAALVLDARAVDFGAVASGEQAERSLSIRNAGLAAATGLRLEWLEAGPDFNARLSGGSVSPGAAVELWLGYSPRGGDGDRALLRLRWEGGEAMLSLTGRQDLRRPD